MTRPSDPIPTPQSLDDLPQATCDALRDAAIPPFAIPPSLDNQILAAARQRLTQPAYPATGRRRLGVTWAIASLAAAAVVALAIVLPQWNAPRQGGLGSDNLAAYDLDRDGQINILDAFAAARSPSLANRPTAEQIARQATLIPADDRAAPPNEHAAIRFTTLAITLDPHGKPLAAYQLNIRAKSGLIRIVGVENGDHPAFADDPPHYDRDAVDANRADRIIIAAYSTQPTEQLPTTPTRVVTLHLQVIGDEPVSYDVRLHTAADTAGQPIQATVTHQTGGQP
ncbi:MAG: hypothetical protein WD042_17865 [Phycisphaeraceae bacterium]